MLVPSAWAGHVVDRGGGCEREPLLDVASLLSVSSLITLSHCLMVFLYACMEVWLDEEEVHVVDWLWW